jgi:hypothetical protein
MAHLFPSQLFSFEYFTSAFSAFSAVENVFYPGMIFTQTFRDRGPSNSQK